MMKNLFLLLWLVLLPATSAYSREYTHYSEWLVNSEIARVDHPYHLDFSPWRDRWNYTVGIELEAMLDTYLRYGDERVASYVQEYGPQMIAADGTVTGYKPADYTLDGIRPGRFILRANDYWPQEGYLQALETMMVQLDNHPRTNAGVWWHKNTYPWQVWLDGIYMGLPFYVMAAPLLRSEKATAYYDDAVNQIVTTEAVTYDAATRLWKHGWDETRSIFWADPTTGLSQHTWGRALGWYAMGIVEVLDALPEDYNRRGELIAVFRKVMQSVVDYQDEASGVWYDVMDVVDSRNYLESTCSSMFTYCLLKGVRLGYLEASYMAKALKAYRGVVKQFIVDNGDGTISITKCCSVSGLGPATNRKRDGSFSYYMSEDIRNNDAKGIAPFIWASLEMEQMGYRIDNLDEDLTAIRSISTAPSSVVSPTYDLQGRPATSRRGIVVSKGRKVIY